jgi:hypothetical protein
MALVRLVNNCSNLLQFYMVIKFYDVIIASPQNKVTKPVG